MPMEDALSALLIELAGQAPTFALLLYLWYGERQERIRITQEYIDRLESLLDDWSKSGDFPDTP